MSQPLEGDVLACVQRIRDGDVDAMDALVQWYQRPVYTMALRFLGDAQDAEDAAQEVFLRAFRRLHQFRGEAKFSTWLFSLAMNTCRNQLRRVSRLRRHAELDAPLAGEADGEGVRERGAPDPRPGPDRLVAGAELHAQIAAAIAELPPDFRAAIVLREMEGLEYEEIAVALDCNIGTVKSRIARGRALLRERLRGYLE